MVGRGKWMWWSKAKATRDAHSLSMRVHMHLAPVPVLSRVDTFTSSKMSKIHTRSMQSEKKVMNEVKLKDEIVDIP